MTITVLRADRLVDGTGAPPVDNPAGVIDEQKVISVGTGEIPAGAVVAAETFAAMRAAPRRAA